MLNLTTACQGVYKRTFGLTHKPHVDYKVFRKACQLAGVLPTKRQLDKFVSHKGEAFKCADKASVRLTGKRLHLA